MSVWHCDCGCMYYECPISAQVNCRMSECTGEENYFVTHMIMVHFNILLTFVGSLI